MKFRIFILLAWIGGLSCRQTENKEEPQKEEASSLVKVSYQNIHSYNGCEVLDGNVYTYLPSGKELHLFTLKFNCNRDTLGALIIGPSPEGEHGLFFYKSELKNLVIDDSSNVSFLLIPGELFEEQITLENYTKTLESSGVDRGEQFFKGKFLADTAIVLNCSSEFYDCYTDEEMIFKLKK